MKNVVPTAEGEASKVKVKVRMNIHGVFFLKSATMIEKLKPEEVEEPTVELPTVESMDTTAPEQPTEAGADVDMTTPPDPTPAPNEEGEKIETPTESTDQATSQDSSPNTDKKIVSYCTNWLFRSNQDCFQDDDKKDAKDTKEPETKKVRKPTIKQVDLPIDEDTASLKKPQLTKANEDEVCVSLKALIGPLLPPTLCPGEHELPGFARNAAMWC